jgi:putative ABC transport system permease protein
MFVFAWRNLLTRPLRTALALVGLSIPILGVIGLFSVSSGLRDMVGDTLSKITGLMVLRDNAISPVFSSLRADLQPILKSVKGVRTVAPEVWQPAPRIEGVGSFNTVLDALTAKDSSKRIQSILDTPLVQGQDIPTHMALRSGVYPAAILPKDGGRFLDERDRGQLNVVMPLKFARSFPIKEGDKSRPRRVGDTIKIGSSKFNIVGIYETGSMFLDVVFVMDIDVARTLLQLPKDAVSSFYVEPIDPRDNDRIAAEVEKRASGVDARSMAEFQANFGVVLSQLDTFLLMVVSLALVVGIVGIINTMLMSTTERFVEFGVLRTNGWSQGNVLGLVTAESAALGLLSGLVGAGLALLLTTLANPFIGGGLKLTITPEQFLLGVGLSLVTGTLGGLYPAWRAARLVPMDAIRLGSH